MALTYLSEYGEIDIPAYEDLLNKRRLECDNRVLACAIISRWHETGTRIQFHSLTA